MNETKEKKPFATPKQYALGAVILVTVIFSFLSVMLSSFMEENLGAHIAILLGGVTGVLFYLWGKKKLDLKRQIKEFSPVVPLMIFLLNWTGCNLGSSIYGMIASRFSSVEPDVWKSLTIPAIIGSVIVAPIGEELMYRLCAVGLMKRTWPKLFTLLFPLAIFSVLHF